VPSETGTTTKLDGTYGAKGFVGWSWQIPVGDPNFDSRHRVIWGFDVLFGPGGRRRAGGWDIAMTPAGSSWEAAWRQGAGRAHGLRGATLMLGWTVL
jgi:hypothetical protein